MSYFLFYIWCVPMLISIHLVEKSFLPILRSTFHRERLICINGSWSVRLVGYIGFGASVSRWALWCSLCVPSSVVSHTWRLQVSQQPRLRESVVAVVQLCWGWAHKAFSGQGRVHPCSGLGSLESSQLRVWLYTTGLSLWAGAQARV